VVKDLSIDYEKATSFMVANFGEKVRKELEKILSSRKSAFQFFSQHTGSKTLTFEQLSKSQYIRRLYPYWITDKGQICKLITNFVFIYFQEKEFDKGDEKMKMIYYCGFASSLLNEVDRALDEVMLISLFYFP